MCVAGYERRVNHLEERAGLQRPDACVFAAAREQLVVRTGLDDDRVVHVPIHPTRSAEVEGTSLQELVKDTHRMMSACLVRFPNRCEENTMVLLPRRVRRRSKRSV